MAVHTISELLNEKGFTYDRSESLVYNYKVFQQAISFGRGVEFLSRSYESTGPVVYLLSVPLLSLDKAKTKFQLEKFNQDLLHHLHDIVKEENDLFKIHQEYLNLYNVVHEQQEEYKLGKDQFFANVVACEFAVKELKSLKLPLVRSYYKGTFWNIPETHPRPINYHDLGTEAKTYLGDLYRLKRQGNIALVKELEKLKVEYFYKKRGAANYYYKGDTSDIIELAVALLETDKLRHRNHSQKIKVHDLYIDLCAFFGVPFSKLSNYLDTLASRKTKDGLFLKKLYHLLVQKLG